MSSFRSVRVLSLLVSGVLLALQAAPGGAAQLDHAAVNALVDSRLSVPLRPSGTQSGDSPRREFAAPIALGINPAIAGQWSDDGAHSVWRWKASAAGAVSISYSFSALALPAGAVMNLYDSEGRRVQGPYHPRGQGAQPFWTALVADQQAVLEIRVPRDRRNELVAELSNAWYGYAPLHSGSAKSSCGAEALCNSDEEWGTAARSTALITVGGRYQCTAVLMNNTRMDGDPLLLTADHCGIGHSADTPASSVIVYWNHRASSCADDRSNHSDSQSGATLLARGSASDFSLLRLDQPPRPEFGVFYAGWDARGLAPGSGAGVHHPRGETTSLSLFNRGALARSARIGGNTVQSWELFWASGVTEPGSSGSALFDQNSRVIGQLSGGLSSCAQPDAADYYGRMDVSFRAGSRSSERLAPWLDPDAHGTDFMDGSPAADVSYAPGAAGQLLPLDVPFGGSGNTAGHSSSADPAVAAASAGPVAQAGGGSAGWLILLLLAMRVRRK